MDQNLISDLIRLGPCAIAYVVAQLLIIYRSK